MAEWQEVYELPPPGNMMPPGEKGRADFVRLGSEIFGNVEEAMLQHFGKIDQSIKVLDFGCGIGRITMPFFHKYKKPDNCVDVSPDCIEFLQHTIPESNPQKNDFVPPLPFPNDSFDCVYSISVWTHLPLHLHWPWLREINRVLKMGGLALISTSGHRALLYRREQRKQEGWLGITDDDLKLEGVICKGVDPKNHPGVTGDYGYVAHDPAWVRREWGRLFQFIETRERGICKMQDLNIMIKIQRTGPSDVTLL